MLDYRDGLTRKEFHELIDGLAKKLACTVTDVQFAAESLQPDAALRARFEAMKNMPLDRKSFLQAIEATVKGMPDDVHAVQFCASVPATIRASSSRSICSAGSVRLPPSRPIATARTNSST